MNYFFDHRYFSQDISGLLRLDGDQPSHQPGGALSPRPFIHDNNRADLLPESALRAGFEHLRPIIASLGQLAAGDNGHDGGAGKEQGEKTALINGVADKLRALLHLVDKTDDLDHFQTIADQLADRGFEQVIIIGTGGSSLGSQALYEMAQRTRKKDGKHYPRLQILINFDPGDFRERIESADWHKTALIAVSKSGDTLETILQTLFVLPLMERQLGRDKIRDHFWVVSQAGDNALNKLANYYSAQQLIHDKNLSGRYSVLSVVGMLPAIIAGLSGAGIRRGAGEMLRLALSPNLATNPTAQSALAIDGLERQKGKTAVVMLSYADRLSTLCRWFRQLWAESLGKGGEGSMPVFATGPVDQHSQLELWLGGPRDKIFTILTTSEKLHLAQSPDYLLAQHPSLAAYQHINLEDMMTACARGMAAVFRDYQLPVRLINVPVLNEESIGALLMHFMLETLFVAFLRGGFDPFDQPKVEHGKEKIRAELAAMNAAKK